MTSEVRAHGIVKPLDAVETKSQGPGPPGWGCDTLTSHMQSAYTNQWATFANKGDGSRRLIGIDSLFARLSKDWRDPTDMLAAILLMRCHGAYRSACMLVMAGHIAEAPSVQRLALEYAGYALHMNRHQLGEAWLSRHDDDASLKLVKQKFTVAKVKETIAACSQETATRFNVLYERAIDFGGHPNERGVTGSMEIKERAQDRLMMATLLHGDGLALDHALKTTAQVGMVCLEIFESIFPQRFQSLGVNAEMLRTRQGL